MELKKLLYKDPSGKLFLRNWKCYYAELIQTAKYEWVSEDYCPVVIDNGFLYIRDRCDKIILESGRRIIDIELMGDLLQDNIFNYGGYRDDMPRFKFGLNIAKKFRLIRLHEDQEARRKMIMEKEKEQGSESGLEAPVHYMKDAAAWMDLARSEPERKPLWLSLWRENEICFLFADSNIGKSLYALQMAFEIARSQKVIYFDYEMDAVEFLNRCTGPDGTICDIPEGFIRCEPDREIFLRQNMENIIIADIEEIVKNSGAKVIIIDNLTFITANAHSSLSVSVLMYRLKLLQRKYSLSILIIAHTSKRNLRKPVTQNDLAGNKKLFNFADSCFIIAQSNKDSGIQYLKQLKTRGGGILYGADNVILMEKVTSDNWLHFETIGYDEERNHLRESKQEEILSLCKEIARLKDEGRSQREIAKILGTSLNKVNRLLRLSP